MRTQTWKASGKATACDYDRTMTTPTLETERLILRPMEISDAPAIQRLLPHWNVVKHMSVVIPWPYPADGAQTFLQDILLPDVAAGRCLSWAITIKELGDELVGAIDFRFDPSPADNRGFWLAEAHWGKGYMSEAVVALNNYVFDELKVERIVTTNAIANTASSHIKSSTAGRIIERKDAEYVGGVFPTEVWEITRSDWVNFRST